jgi:hypothetical protein
MYIVIEAAATSAFAENTSRRVMTATFNAIDFKSSLTLPTNRSD